MSAGYMNYCFLYNLIYEKKFRTTLHSGRGMVGEAGLEIDTDGFYH